MALRLADGTAWAETLARAVAATPEAFDPARRRHPAQPGRRATGVRSARRPRSAHPGRQHRARQAAPAGRRLRRAPRSPSRPTSTAHWAATPLAERKARVTAALDALTAHRDLLALLLVWEIGKPWRLACADVDRALDGVRWYVEEIDRQIAGREPLPGPVSNIAAGTTR